MVVYAGDKHAPTKVSKMLANDVPVFKSAKRAQLKFYKLCKYPKKLGAAGI